MVPRRLFPLHPYRLAKLAAMPFHRLVRLLPELAQGLEYLLVVPMPVLRPLLGANHSFFFVFREFGIALQKALHMIRTAQNLG